MEVDESGAEPGAEAAGQADAEPAAEPSAGPNAEPFGSTQGSGHWNACGVHREAAATFTCSRCGTFGCPECLDSMQPMPLCVACAARGVNAVPWERRETVGLWRGFWDTTFELCLRPKEFFARPAVDSLGGGAFYGVVAYTAGNMAFVLQFALLYGVIGLVAGLSSGNEAAGAAMGIGIGALGCIMVPIVGVQAPVMAVFGMAFGMAGAHLSLTLMKQARGSWEASLRGVGYANAAYMWLAVPCVGLFISPFAVVWLEARAISAAHETSTFVAFAAVVMWRLLLTTLLFAVYMLFLAAVMGMVPGTLGPSAP
ncbi:MAG: hypothetical protein KC593_07915 [Myxococcales bacterium]|nr:hypothetical protein [Myxococcales bacterium]